MNIRIAAFIVLLVANSTSGAVARSQSQCKADAAIWFGLLVAGFEADRSPRRLIVRENAWNKFDWSVKSDIATTINCALVPEGMSVGKMLYVSDLSGQTLAIWDGLRLRAP